MLRHATGMDFKKYNVKVENEYKLIMIEQLLLFPESL
jgi:hypothetical protein